MRVVVEEGEVEAAVEAQVEMEAQVMDRRGVTITVVVIFMELGMDMDELCYECN